MFAKLFAYILKTVEVDLKTVVREYQNRPGAKDACFVALKHRLSDIMGVNAAP